MLMGRDGLYCVRSVYGWDLYDFWGIYSLSGCHLWNMTGMCKFLLLFTGFVDGVVLHPNPTASRSMVRPQAIFRCCKSPLPAQSAH